MSVSVALSGLVDQYLAARYRYESSRLGPKTDKALAAMDRILAKADRMGLGDDLVQAVTR